MKMVLAIVTFLSGLLGTATWAQEHGTAEEAKAMAAKAAQYLRDVGPETAFAAFNAKDGPWHDRDLYVFVDQGSVIRAHGVSPSLINKDMSSLKDVDGKSFVMLIAEVKDTGWVDYKWQDPVSKKIEPKSSYVVRVGEYSVGVGIFK